MPGRPVEAARDDACPVLQRHIEDYLGELHAVRAVSSGTMSAYRSDLRRFSAFTVREGAEGPERWDFSFFARFREELETEGASPSTIARMISTLRGFLRYLERNGVSGAGPALAAEERLVRPRTGESSRRVLTREEVRRLLDAPPETDWAGLRDRALLEVLYSSGIRAYEASRVTVGAADLRLGLLTVTDEAGTERTVPLTESACAAVIRYLRIMRGVIHGPGEPLFSSAAGSALSRQSIWKIARRSGQRAGIGTPVTPALIRATMAAHLMEDGADPARAAAILGCRSVSSVYRAARS